MGQARIAFLGDVQVFGYGMHSCTFRVWRERQPESPVIGLAPEHLSDDESNPRCGQDCEQTPGKTIFGFRGERRATPAFTA
jgi:hypothetical protein